LIFGDLVAIVESVSRCALTLATLGR